MNAHAFSFSRNRIAALAAAATSILLTGAVCRAATNPLGFLSYTQTVTAAFASPAEASAATLSATPLPQGAKLAFTTRWDDSNWAHRSKAAMLRRAGCKGTFFLNENEKFFREVAPELLAGGHALGNHSLSHPFLTESAPNLVFREILRNRVLIESRCDTTVVSFVIPFNWGSPVDTERPSFIGNILVNTGHYVSSDWPLDAIGLPPDTWMPAHTFSADDGQPNAERFAQNLKKALDDAEKTPEIPRVAFGIHSWCKEDGERVQEACLRQVRGNPDWFYGNDNEYGAYRYSALHGAIRKTGVSGSRATFEVERFAPSQLGSLQPLSLAFSGADPTAVSVAGTALQADVRGLYTLPHAPEWTLPKAVDLAAPDGTSAEIPGIRFTLAPDEKAGTLAATLRNDSAADFTDLCLVVNPPPAWEKGRITVRLPRLAAGKTHTETVALGTRAADPACREGLFYYAASLEFLAGTDRYRLWAEAETQHPKSVHAATTPRDCALTLGPFETERFDEAHWIAASVPGVKLDHLGRGLHEFWRSQADPERAAFSAIAYMPWGPTSEPSFIAAIRDFTNAHKATRLLALDFEVPADGTGMLITPLANWESAIFYLNGTKFERKGGRVEIPVRKGINRIILQAPIPNAYNANSFQMTVCRNDFRDSFPCRRPDIVPYDWEYNAPPVLCDFFSDGRIRTLTLNGQRLLSDSILQGKFVYREAPDAPEHSIEWKQADLAKDAAKFSRTADGFVCETRFPVAGADGKPLYTVTERKLVKGQTLLIEASACFERDAQVRGDLFETRLYWPVELFQGGTLTIGSGETAQRRAFTDNPAENRINAPHGFSVASSAAKLGIQVPEGVVTGFFDRREWNQQTVNIIVGTPEIPRWGSQLHSIAKGDVFRTRTVFTFDAP